MSVALLRPYSSLDYLDTPELRAEYLAAAVEEGDPGVIAQARALLGNTAAPSPPPVNDLWRIPAILAIVGAIVLWVHLFIPQPAKAETIGYRIEAEACRGTVCRPLAASPRVWGGLYACQGRAANIARFGLPGDRREIRARCAAIDGMPSA